MPASLRHAGNESAGPEFVNGLLGHEPQRADLRVGKGLWHDNQIRWCRPEGVGRARGLCRPRLLGRPSDGLCAGRRRVAAARAAPSTAVTPRRRRRAGMSRASFSSPQLPAEREEMLAHFGQPRAPLAVIEHGDAAHGFEFLNALGNRRRPPSTGAAGFVVDGAIRNSACFAETDWSFRSGTSCVSSMRPRRSPPSRKAFAAPCAEDGACAQPASAFATASSRPAWLVEPPLATDGCHEIVITLDLDERRTIFRLLNAKVPVAAIARQLGRHRSTIHREVRRNHFHEQREYAGYFPLTAQDRARQRRQRRASCAGTNSCGATSSTSSNAAGHRSRSPGSCGWTPRTATASVTRRSINTSTGRRVVPPVFTATCPKLVGSAGHVTAASRAHPSSRLPAPSPSGHRRPKIARLLAIGRQIC